MMAMKKNQSIELESILPRSAVIHHGREKYFPLLNRQCLFQGNRTNLCSTLALATRVYCSRAKNRPVGTKEMIRDAVGTPTTKK